MKTTKSTKNTKNTSNKKRRWLPLFLCLFLLAAAGGVFAVSKVKPDWLYLARQSVTGLFSSAEFEAFTPEAETLQTASAEELTQGAYGCIYGTELFLVNEDHPLPAGYTPSLITYQDTEVSMSPLLEEPYRRLSEDIAARFQDTLYIRSSYRSAEEQAAEKEEQPAVAAASGASEHETGMALDVYIPYYGGYGFLKTDAGQYVNSHCWEYGFIIRYPFLKTGSTGIPFEPWHLRYVGLPHAEIMEKNSWTLEEYFERLVPGNFYRSGNYWISRQEGPTLTWPATESDFHISPDNQGGYVLWGTEQK